MIRALKIEEEVVNGQRRIDALRMTISSYEVDETEDRAVTVATLVPGVTFDQVVGLVAPFWSGRVF